MAKQPEDKRTYELSLRSRQRGPYYSYPQAGLGGFIKSLRKERRMTQAQYAEFLGVSLRTLVTAEKETSKYGPYSGSAIGESLARREFANEFEMQRAFREFLAPIGNVQ